MVRAVFHRDFSTWPGQGHVQAPVRAARSSSSSSCASVQMCAPAINRQENKIRKADRRRSSFPLSNACKESASATRLVVVLFVCVCRRCARYIYDFAPPTCCVSERVSERVSHAPPPQYLAPPHSPVRGSCRLFLEASFRFGVVSSDSEICRAGTSVQDEKRSTYSPSFFSISGPPSKICR